MADKVDIFMPLYVGDYLADTSDLSAEEHGAYLLLMMGAWRREGRLPTDPTLLSRIAQVPRARWAKVWAAVGRFFDVDGGAYVQRRLMAELDKAMGKKAAASVKGSKGANARWGHGAGNAPGMPQAQPELSGGQSLTDRISESPSGSLSGSSPTGTGIPDPAGARVAPSVPVTGHSLCLLFGRVRRHVTGKGLDWQSVTVAQGKGTSMAELVNATPGAVADVERTMELLFRNAQAGKAGNRSADIVRDASFAFGAWCSQWTALREELHGVAPALPETPPEKRVESFAVAAERQRKEAALEERVERTIRDLAPKVPVKSPRQEWRERQEKEQQEKGAAGT